MDKPQVLTLPNNLASENRAIKLNASTQVIDPKNDMVDALHGEWLCHWGFHETSVGPDA